MAFSSFRPLAAGSCRICWQLSCQILAHISGPLRLVKGILLHFEPARVPYLDLSFWTFKQIQAIRLTTKESAPSIASLLLSAPKLLVLAGLSKTSPHILIHLHHLAACRVHNTSTWLHARIIAYANINIWHGRKSFRIDSAIQDYISLVIVED